MSQDAVFISGADNGSSNFTTVTLCGFHCSLHDRKISSIFTRAGNCDDIEFGEPPWIVLFAFGFDIFKHDQCVALPDSHKELLSFTSK